MTVNETPMPIDFFAALENTETDPTGGFAEFVEPLAIILHSFDPYAIAHGIQFVADSDDKKAAYRFMAESVLHGIGPSIERRAEQRFMSHDHG